MMGRERERGREVWSRIKTTRGKEKNNNGKHDGKQNHKGAINMETPSKTFTACIAHAGISDVSMETEWHSIAYSGMHTVAGHTYTHT